MMTLWMKLAVLAVLGTTTPEQTTHPAYTPYSYDQTLTAVAETITAEEAELILTVDVEEEINYWMIKEHFGFDDTVIEDILHVALHTAEEPMLIAHIVSTESGGDRDVINYCKVWGEPFYNESKERWEKKCVKLGSCYTNCRKKRHVWRNHLDVGLYQLRDVVERVGGPEDSKRFCGWSWLRDFERDTGRDVSSECALERFCARDAMIHAVHTLREEQLAAAHRGVGKANCRGLPDEWKWMGLWNGCKSARNHADHTAPLVEMRDFHVRLTMLRYRIDEIAEKWPLLGYLIVPLKGQKVV